MLKKFLTFLFVCCVFMPLWGEVSVMKITDEDKHAKKEDFYHTFEYYISSAGQTGAKCQATRIGKRWSATAAHCVADLCKKNCTIRMDLLEQNISAFAEVTHSSKKPAVFVHPEYSKQKLVANDFALIKLDLRNAPITYYMHTSKNAPNIAISKKQFDSFLEKNRKAKSQFAHTLSPDFPPIAVFDDGNYLLDRKISVISIFDGKREIKPDPNPVYYVQKLGYCYTKNFGIRQGMSGSGVMTNTGELIGIISAHVDAVLSTAQKQQQTDFFMFPVFNTSLILFMENVMGSDFYQLDRVDAYPNMVRKTRHDFTPVIQLMKNVDKKLRE